MQLFLRACMHDSEMYPDPDTFQPERFIREGRIDPDVRDPNAFVFGYGRRLVHGTLLLFVHFVTSPDFGS